MASCKLTSPKLSFEQICIIIMLKAGHLMILAPRRNKSPKWVVHLLSCDCLGLASISFSNRRWYRCARAHCKEVMPCNLILIVSLMMMRYILLRNRWAGISFFLCSVGQLWWTGGSPSIYHLSANLCEIWLNNGRNFKEWIWTIYWLFSTWKYNQLHAQKALGNFF